MFLKYYCNGWNYISNIENVKWANFNIWDLFQEAYKNIQDFKLEYVVENGDELLASLSMTSVPAEHKILVSPENVVFFNYIIGALDKKLISINEKTRFVSLELTRNEIETIIKHGYEMPVPSSINSHLHTISYNKNGERQTMCFLGNGFLCNDGGKTIERIR